jgi:hypothetical protein
MVFASVRIKRFHDSTGLALPIKEDINDPVFRKYNAFRKSTSEELFYASEKRSKSKPKLIINTYTDVGVDLIRVNRVPGSPMIMNGIISLQIMLNPYSVLIKTGCRVTCFNISWPLDIGILLHHPIFHGYGYLRIC